MKIRNEMLPVLGPKGGKEEIEALTEVIESGWWGKGPKVEEFEDKFSKMVGHKYAVAVTSASHGQDLVMKAMNFKNIDVINPAISFIATTSRSVLVIESLKTILPILPNPLIPILIFPMCFKI